MLVIKCTQTTWSISNNCCLGDRQPRLTLFKFICQADHLVEKLLKAVKSSEGKKVLHFFFILFCCIQRGKKVILLFLGEYRLNCSGAVSFQSSCWSWTFVSLVTLSSAWLIIRSVLVTVAVWMLFFFICRFWCQCR